MEALQQLLNTRTDIWRGRVQPPTPTVSTGQSALDQRLPGHGWPCGQLIELQPIHVGCGELSITWPLLARQTQRGQPVMLISPPLIPCPQAWAQAGIDLTRLWIVRTQSHSLWTAEHALQSGLCGVVMVWSNSTRLTTTHLRRLQLACEYGHAPCFLIDSDVNRPVTTFSALRLTIAPGPTVTLTHTRRAQPLKSNTLKLTPRTLSAS